MSAQSCLVGPECKDAAWQGETCDGVMDRYGWFSGITDSQVMREGLRKSGDAENVGAQQRMDGAEACRWSGIREPVSAALSDDQGIDVCPQLLGECPCWWRWAREDLGRTEANQTHNPRAQISWKTRIEAIRMGGLE